MSTSYMPSWNKLSLSSVIAAFLIGGLLISCSSEKNSERIQPETQNRTVNQVVVNEDLSIDNSEIIELPSDVLRRSVQNHLSDKGKSLGTVNADGSIYAIGTASTGIPSARNGFINSRNIAFQKAEMRAKLDILSSAGEIITSERRLSMVSKSISGEDPAAERKATIIEKALKVVDSSLDYALQELGVSEAEIAQLNESQKGEIYSERFSNYVSSYVAHMIRGVAVIKIIEGEVGSNDYEVAVAVKYSPENQSLAASQEQLGADENVLKSSSVGEIREASPENLVSQFGSRLFKDENGNFFVVGFGQSSVRKSDNRQSTFISIARRQARLRAVENIKNFLSEDLIAQEIQSTVENIYELSDGSQGIYTEDNYSQLIESKKSTVQMNTLAIRDWDAVHPVSNTRLVGTVVILTNSNNVNFSNSEATSTTEKSEYLESTSFDNQDF